MTKNREKTVKKHFKLKFVENLSKKCGKNSCILLESMLIYGSHKIKEKTGGNL